MLRFLQVIFCLVCIFIFSTTHATNRSSNTAVLDVDASGEVDALTDGLLLLRSMFGLSDDALTTGVVSPDCVDCDATKISQYITSVEGKTYADLNSTDDQNISGSLLDGTTLTIGIENGQSETVDLSSLEDGTGITADQANQLSAAMNALNCIAAIAPPDDEEEEEHSDEHNDVSYPEFWIYTQSCIKDAFEGI